MFWYSKIQKKFILTLSQYTNLHFNQSMLTLVPFDGGRCNPKLVSFETLLFIGCLIIAINFVAFQPTLQTRSIQHSIRLATLLQK